MSKMIGIGTVLKCSTAGTTTYGLTVGQVRSVNRSGVSVDAVETSTLDDAPNKTFAAGWVDGGELGFEVAYDPSTTIGHSQLNTLLTGRVMCKWKLILPTTTLFEEFDGFVSGVDRPIEQASLIVQTFTVKVSGAPGLTAWST